MTPILRPTFAVSLLLAGLLACGERAPEPAGEEAPPIPPDSAPVAGPAPVDSVIAWAEDIRAGIAALPERVAEDPEGARQRAVELYVTRQERIEQTVGPGTGAPPDLADAVHESEARFHDLMQLLGETPPPTAERVAAAVETLDARVGTVLELVDRPADLAGDGASR